MGSVDTTPYFGLYADAVRLVARIREAAAKGGTAEDNRQDLQAAADGIATIASEKIGTAAMNILGDAALTPEGAVGGVSCGLTFSIDGDPWYPLFVMLTQVQAGVEALAERLELDNRDKEELSRFTDNIDECWCGLQTLSGYALEKQARRRFAIPEGLADANAPAADEAAVLVTA